MTEQGMPGRKRSGHPGYNAGTPSDSQRSRAPKHCHAVQRAAKGRAAQRKRCRPMSEQQTQKQKQTQTQMQDTDTDTDAAPSRSSRSSRGHPELALALQHCARIQP